VSYTQNCIVASTNLQHYRLNYELFYICVQWFLKVTCKQTKLNLSEFVMMRYLKE